MLTKLIVATVLVSAGFAVGRASEAPSHVYELRIYTPNEGKLDAVNARFRDHTRAIFDRHHMKCVGYWLPTEGPRAGTFVYILEHPSRQKVKAESEANGKLVANVESVFMAPTEYSPIK